MPDLSTKYLGLELRNPIIAAASGLTEDLESIQEFEKYGVGAVVLKSLFEEEIIAEIKKQMHEMARPSSIYPEIYDFFDYESQEDTLTKYIHLIEQAKKHTNIPIIASVNCVTPNEWTSFAKQMEEAGADALELNVFLMPSDLNRSAAENEQVYFDIIKEVSAVTSLPVSLKISQYFSNLASMIRRLSETEIKGIVLFNRFFSPDFDTDKFSVVPVNVYSTADELSTSLRWIAIMADRVQCDLSASTGVHYGISVVKQLLAGATTVQAASAFYKNGKDYVAVMLKELETWMIDKGFDRIDQFRGKMSQKRSENPAAYERAQFMKHFGGRH
jgi:dihydroorotate dehydrogenase (fumarate)